MIELVATAVITVSSFLLFGYWFRYTCLLILSAKTTRDYAGEVAAANQLRFLQVQSQLREAVPAMELTRLHAALNEDFALVAYLLKNSANSESVESSLEARMLEFNYRLMDGWYRVSRRFSAQAAACALDEMSSVIAHFANSMGERAAVGAAA